MLGEILGGLTNAATAEDVITAVAAPEMLERVKHEAATEGVPIGVLVATKVRHLVDHGGEDVWLDLIGTMAGSPVPGAAAIERMLARTFPAS